MLLKEVRFHPKMPFSRHIQYLQFIALENHYFYLAHFNIAVATSEGEYPPCEIAIVKFSLLDGIAKCYHDFVEPGIFIYQIYLGTKLYTVVL